jgi:hypothetical protein
MNMRERHEKIRHILGQITALEEELRESLHEQEHTLFYHIKGKSIEFERSIKDTHRQMKVGIFRWFLSVRPQNYITGPVIYGMIVPLLILDICITFYQATCFPIYGIAKARRSDYILFDHRHLAYLNIFDKAHCLYCSYANGLIAYALEITARTEQYFCPIKHAHKILGSHSRYPRFLDYGEANDFQAKREALRSALAEEKTSTQVPHGDNKKPPNV